ncbi:hypothetical protein NliqN6_5565 [Naganishia liquefaciens]|uniref:Uncharacterized protein n=1 Tax=Naganishia liquefaciens TaxID=104408 RepID=A0A8H3TYH6_9TREE|nr:hypothetical protein NliqN6_5565 [Naganishia liquefaciens]
MAVRPASAYVSGMASGTPATEEEFELALDRANINAHDQNGQLRIRLRNHHRTTPWCRGTDFTKWIMDRYEEIHQQRMRARSASAAPASSPTPTQESRAVPIQQAQPTAINAAQNQNAIGRPPHSTVQSPTSTTHQVAAQSSHQAQARANVIQLDLKPPAVKVESRDDHSPSLAGSSTLSSLPSSSSYPIYASGIAIDKVEDEGHDARQKSSSSPGPLAAAVVPTDIKPRVQEDTKPQVVGTVDPQERMVERLVPSIHADLKRPSPVPIRECTRSVSVSSLGSSAIRPSPTPSAMQTEPERERSLKESEQVNFPSPPPSDSEFEVPIRQPFEKSGREINLQPRKTIKPLEKQVPRMEWTQLLPRPVPTPPGSSTRSSSPSDSVDVDSYSDNADGDDVLRLTSGSTSAHAKQSGKRVNVATASQASTKKRVGENSAGNLRQNDASKGRAEKRLVSVSEKAPTSKAKVVPLKEWERREFIAPRENELKEETSDRLGKPIKFEQVLRLLPPIINGSTPADYQAKLDAFKRMLYPDGTAKPTVELYLNQLAWVVHQMIVAPQDYRKVLARPSNLPLLERFLRDAYERSEMKSSSDKDKKKANITIWRSTKVAYLVNELVRKLNPSDEVLESTKIARRLREWSRKDDDIRKAVEGWMLKDMRTQSAPGATSAAAKRKADNDAVSTNKKSRLSGENGRRDSTSAISTSASKSGNATVSASAMNRKSAGGDLMDSFLAPTASSRPTRPVPSKKPSSNDPLAQAFASIAAAQTPVAEPETTRKTPDPTRAPRTGRDGKPRPHMTVRWKEGPSLVSIRKIEARDPTESHEGSAREMEMEEGALLRRQPIWHTPREMEYRGSPDVTAVALDETMEQSRREQGIPAVLYADEDQIPVSADESNVQVARLDDDFVRIIPLYKEEAQAAIPSHQYLQHQQQEAQGNNSQTRISNPSTPVVVPALPVNGNLSYGFGGQNAASNNVFAGANPLAGGLNFNVSALAQNLQNLQNLVPGGGFSNQGGFNPQTPFNQFGYNATQAYNSQSAYGQQAYNSAGYNAQQGFQPESAYNTQPVYSPPGGQRRVPPIHPDRLNPDRRDADRQGGNFRRRAA